MVDEKANKFHFQTPRIVRNKKQFTMSNKYTYKIRTRNDQVRMIILHISKAEAGN